MKALTLYKSSWLLAAIFASLACLAYPQKSLAADSISVTRSDGTLDAFAVVPCAGQCAPGSFQLRHTAIATYGTGTVYSNDDVTIQGGAMNLITAYWINSNQDGPHMELHIRLYLGTGVSECIWGNGNVPLWTGPFALK